MRTKLALFWGRVSVSLWFLPSLMTLGAAGLAAATVELDSSLQASRRADLYFAFGGGVEGARGVLTAIASTMITVTGVIFSITIVALQLASSQFTPRVLRNFMADRISQGVLGVFIATFTYTLLVLRTVRSADDDGSAFVPAMSVGVAIGLALLSIGALILYIHHAARSIQVAVVLDRATRETLGLVDRLFPEPIGGPADDAEPPGPAGPGATVTTPTGGYLQAVDEDAIFAVPSEGRLTIWMEPRIGEFILPGSSIATVWPAAAVDEHVAHAICQAFILDYERTLQQDVELGVRQIADIALRALSPGVNDPTTAVACLNRLAEILVRFGTRRMPRQVRTAEDGRVSFVARATTFEQLVEASLPQLRHYGIADPIFAAHLVRTVGRVGALVPPERRAVLADHAREMLAAAEAALDRPEDRRRIEAVGAAALASLEAPSHGGASGPTPRPPVTEDATVAGRR